MLFINSVSQSSGLATPVYMNMGSALRPFKKKKKKKKKVSKTWLLSMF